MCIKYHRCYITHAYTVTTVHVCLVYQTMSFAFVGYVYYVNVYRNKQTIVYSKYGGVLSFKQGPVQQRQHLKANGILVFLKIRNKEDFNSIRY